MSVFDKLFGSHRPSEAPESRLPAERQAAVGASDAAHRAAQMLRAPTTLMQLSQDEALAVVGFMRPRVFKSGTQIIRQGEAADTGFMVLVLEGEITVESQMANRVNAATIKVLGPGSLIGEMALVDSAARSASCTASTEVKCAVLTRESLEALTTEQPALRRQAHDRRGPAPGRAAARKQPQAAGLQQAGRHPATGSGPAHAHPARQTPQVAAVLGRLAARPPPVD